MLTRSQCRCNKILTAKIYNEYDYFKYNVIQTLTALEHGINLVVILIMLLTVIVARINSRDRPRKNRKTFIFISYNYMKNHPIYYLYCIYK